jgi:hypothetical protein
VDLVGTQKGTCRRRQSFLTLLWGCSGSRFSPLAEEATFSKACSPLVAASKALASVRSSASFLAQPHGLPPGSSAPVGRSVGLF